MENIDALWLYLEPYTFISEDANYFFFYNADDGTGISFHKNKEIIPLVRQLQDAGHLYSINIAIKDLENEDIYNFVKTIQASGCGDIIEGNLSKPVVMPPLLNLQRSVERLKQHDVPISENVLPYLHEVAIYVNGECPLNCKECQHGFKQHLCCTKSNNTLDFTLLKDFLFAISGTEASITIVGGDIFQYPELKEVLYILQRIPAVHILVTHWQNIPQDSEVLELLAYQSFRLKIIINDFYSIATIVTLAKKLKQSNIDQLWEINITSLSEYEKAEILNEQLADLNIEVTIKPFYNGENLEFFEENVFTDIEDFDAFKLDRQEIFALQALNTHDFGKIIIQSDGKVYANMNNEPIGDIKENIEEILAKELEAGTSWRRTHYEIEPCNQCRFKLICPSPSNYEIAMGKNNLCHVNS